MLSRKSKTYIYFFKTRIYVITRGWNIHILLDVRLKHIYTSFKHICMLSWELVNIHIYFYKTYIYVLEHIYRFLYIGYTYIGFFRTQILPFSLYMTFAKHIYVFFKHIYVFQNIYFVEMKMHICALWYVHIYVSKLHQNPYFDETKCIYMSGSEKLRYEIVILKTHIYVLKITI